MKASFVEDLFIYLFVICTFLTLFVYDISNINFKPANAISCHEPKKQNEASDDKGKKYEE